MNFYWPVYKNLESELNKIMFEIHIDDNQLKVYSSRIGDLIVRATTEIESISKSLYSKYGGEPKDNLKYDYDCIKHLEMKFKLSEKVVLLNSPNCFQTNRILRPYRKTVNSTITRKLTFNWNNAYQNIEHDRVSTIQYASIENLFSAMSALYLLNIYFKNYPVFIDRYTENTVFDDSQDSDIFKVLIDYNSTVLSDISYWFYESPISEKCVFWLKPNPPSLYLALENLHNRITGVYNRFNYELVHTKNVINDNDQYLKYLDERNKRLMDELNLEYVDVDTIEYFVVLDDSKLT